MKMNPFAEKPTMVQLTDMGAARIPRGESWMVFDVDSLEPSPMRSGEWNCHVRDYRYGKDPVGNTWTSLSSVGTSSGRLRADVIFGITIRPV